jgi:hypothetical protein
MTIYSWHVTVISETVYSPIQQDDYVGTKYRINYFHGYLHLEGAAEIVKHFKTLVTRFSARISLSTGV